MLWGSTESDATESDEEMLEDFFCAITWVVYKVKRGLQGRLSRQKGELNI